MFATFLISCSDDDEIRFYFNESLLIGKWKSETLFFEYFADYTGTSRDVVSNETNSFTWRLQNSELQLIFGTGSSAYRIYYTMIELTDSTLIYKDQTTRTTYSFTRFVGLDEDLLIGKWQVDNTNAFFRFNSNHTGRHWDESDDVMEREGIRFNWALNGFELELGFISEMIGGVLVWEFYTITYLSTTTLKIRDDLGRTISLTKIDSNSENEIEFDENLLIGKWRVGSTNQFYRFNTNKTGKFWNADEMDETMPGGEFEWRLNGVELELGFYSHMIGGVLFWEVYTISTLTVNSLVMRDDRNRTISLTKVE